MSSYPGPPPPQGNWYPPHGPPPKSSNAAGIIVGVVAVVFLVIPIMAVLAIFGVRQYLANAKGAEARNSVGFIARAAADAYERDHKHCASASSPVPSNASFIRGTKYMSNPAEWQLDKDAHAGFACLGFEMSSPQYYQYDYQSTGTAFTATARGDLNGDGQLSSFTVTGKVVGDRLVVSTGVDEVNPKE
jgi:type IV pilus assembly protein PilA